MARRSHSNRNDNGSMLASVFILTLGASCALFTVATMAPASMVTAMWIVGAVVGVFLVFIILQRFGKLPNTNLGFLATANRNRRDDGAADYEPRRAGGDLRPVTEGTNRPISAEEAHELKVNSPNTWVPSQSRRRRHRKS